MENKNHTFSILFYLRKVKTDASGNTPIYTRITVNGQRAEFSISRSIAAQRWNSKGQRVKGNGEESRELNTYIDTVRSKLYKQHRELIDKNKLATAEAIRNGYLGITEKKLSLIEAINYHNDQAKQKVNVDFAPATLAKYSTFQKHIIEFLKNNYKTSDIYLTELNFKFITDFESYLKINLKHSHNHAIKLTSILRKVVKLALDNDWLEKNPFIKYHSSLAEVKREALTQEELDMIQEKHFTIPRLEQVKDIFIFSCFSGLAYVDVAKLTPQDIQPSMDGEKWIYIYRTKTGTKSMIPLLPPALAIVEKYKEHPECKINGKLLPVISNQKVNAYLKEIGDICSIKKNLTFHLARHSFATTVLLSNGFPLESISAILGHKNVVITSHYAKVKELKVSGDFKTLKARLFPQKKSSKAKAAV